MSIGLIGRKLGVTQVFQGDGTMVAVSVLVIEPNTVTRLRTDERDGSTARPRRARGQPGGGPRRGGPRKANKAARRPAEGPAERQRPLEDAARVPRGLRRRLRGRPEAGPRGAPHRRRP